MISATAAGTHRFGRVKRNGYDPAEVDAVVGRLLDALALQDDRIRVLEDKLDDSQVSATAITRTLAAVERTATELLTEVETTAVAIVRKAMDDAAEIALLADELGAEISARRDTILTDAYLEADELIASAQLAIAEQEVAAAALATRQVGDASRDAEQIAQEADVRSRTAAMIAAWRLRESQTEADRHIAEAEGQAAAIIEEANQESRELGRRITNLRTAVSHLQSSAAELARTTIVEADVIDLNAIEAADTPPGPPVRLAPVQKPIAVVEPDPEVEHGPETYYQRRTGGIKERIKIARSTP
jgi:DivIVA domain-containing protein